MRVGYAFVAAIAGLGIAAIALGQPASPRDSQRPSVSEDGGDCLPAGRLQGASLAVLGAYEGRRKTALTLADAEHETGVIDVAAAEAGPPLILVLTAYDPVIWDLRRVPRHRLRAVIAYGYYDQGVAGVPRAIPVRFGRSRDELGPCGQIVYAYEGGRNLERLAASLEQVTGLRIDRFQGAYAPEGFHVDRGPLPAPGPALGSADVRAAVAVARDVVEPQAAGLRQLVREGAIRAATPADIATLEAALTRASPTGHLAPVRAEGLRPGSTYVVLRAIRVPRGMYGGHSATFLVPPGVPDPVDPGSHNSYYSLADGSCRGAVC